MRAMVAMGLLGGLLLAGCGSNRNCKDACTRLQGCNIIQAGLSCDSSCGDTQGTCAECLNDNTCADLIAGKCASHCPGVDLKKYQ